MKLIFCSCVLLIFINRVCKRPGLQEVFMHLPISGFRRSARSLPQASKAPRFSIKVKSCYNPLRLETVIVLVSSGIDFVNTPRLYSDMICARGSPKCLDFTRNTPQLNQLCPR